MSRWGDYGWYRTPAKKPPPAHGIKMKKAGTTWWGQRWILALELVLRGDAGRLARGRTYARAGRTHDLVVSGGTVTAKVTGSRPTPYRITIQLAQLPAPAWAKAIAGMARQAQFAAELLAGQMPQQIADVFRDAGTHLFPAQRADLVTSCTCPDWGDPCKHVAATHYVLGEALDRDPFLLFELRGRTKAQVLEALRAARAGEEPGKPPGHPSDKPSERLSKRGAASAAAVAELEIPKVTLGKIKATDYDRPREALPALQLSFDEPGTHGAVLVQLGAPAAWSTDGSPADLLAPLVRAAAARARSIALAEPVAEADSVPPQTARGENTQPAAARPTRASTVPAMPTTAKPARTSRPSQTSTVRATPSPAKPMRAPTPSQTSTVRATPSMAGTTPARSSSVRASTTTVKPTSRGPTRPIR
jgi:uncharacterized Zn finger protein